MEGDSCSASNGSVAEEMCSGTRATPLDSDSDDDIYFIPPSAIDFYSNSPAHFVKHEEKMQDVVWIKAYRSAVGHSTDLFEGKVILDIGCGAGILSILAARAGAARVIGIESSNIAKYAESMVKVNKLDHIIQIIQGKVEEVALPESIKKVDIIISDWMGYSLFYDSLIEDVIYARDKWLRPGGLIFPDKAELSITAIEDRNYMVQKIKFWNQVQGFNLSSVKKAALSKPVIGYVKPSKVFMHPSVLLTMDLNTMRKENLAFEAPFELMAKQGDYIYALSTYFTVEFSKCRNKTWFSTSPLANYTHWKQTTFYLDDYAAILKGEVVSGVFSLKQKPSNSRDVEIKIKVDFDGKFNSLHEENSYHMR